MSEPHDLTLALLERELSAAGHDPRCRFHGEEPFVAIVDLPRSRSRGRFFPSRNAILVAARPGDREVTLATVNHERAHAAMYVKTCGGTSPGRLRACGYVGDHTRRFYEVLERMHRTERVSPRAARIVEEGGGYKYPNRWMGEEWR